MADKPRSPAVRYVILIAIGVAVFFALDIGAGALGVPDTMWRAIIIGIVVGGTIGVVNARLENK